MERKHGKFTKIWQQCGIDLYILHTINGKCLPVIRMMWNSASLSDLFTTYVRDLLDHVSNLRMIEKIETNWKFLKFTVRYTISFLGTQCTDKEH